MIQTVLAYGCLLVSALTYDIHSFILDYWKTKSLKELPDEHPQFAQLKQIYLVLYAVFFILLVFATFLFLIATDRFGSLSFLLIVPFLNLFKMLNGIIGLRTGLYFTGYRGITRYYYDESRQKVWVAYVQIGLAMLLSFVSLILYFWK